VAVRVVEALEVIEVDKDHPQRTAVALRALPLDRHLTVEAFAVGKSSEVVKQRDALDRGRAATFAE
jgi:hypothetical protein